MIVRWTPEAEQDRMAIWDYITAENRDAGIRMDELFSEAAERLSIYLEMGRQGRVSGTREFIVHEHYCLVYEFDGQTVWILTLVHTARQWPPCKR